MKVKLEMTQTTAYMSESQGQTHENLTRWEQQQYLATKTESPH